MNPSSLALIGGTWTEAVSGRSSPSATPPRRPRRRGRVLRRRGCDPRNRHGGDRRPGRAGDPLLERDGGDPPGGLANDSRYGLAAYFYTQDASRLFRVAEALEYGIVGANDALPSTPQAPFGGMKESGLGREGGKWGLDLSLETKYVSAGT